MTLLKLTVNEIQAFVELVNDYDILLLPIM